MRHRNTLLLFWSENAFFLWGFLLFFTAGMLWLFNIQQGDEILYFSNRRSAFGDFFFKYFTRMGEGILFLFAFLAFLLIRYRTAIYIPLLGIAVMLLSALFKNWFAQPRPYKYFEELNRLDQLTFVEGAYVNKGLSSFPSGHTMAAFALYAFLAFVAPSKKGLALLLLLIAVLVGISRIYLVQHFLQDVLSGGFLGVLLAIFCYYLHQRYPSQTWADQSLLHSGNRV